MIYYDTIEHEFGNRARVCKQGDQLGNTVGV